MSASSCPFQSTLLISSITILGFFSQISCQLAPLSVSMSNQNNDWNWARLKFTLSCMQIEQQVMYNKFDFSLDSLAVIAFAGPAGHSGQQGGSNVLFPLSMTGSAELRKLPYKRLPQAKVWLSAEIVEVTATPQHLQLLTSLAEQHKRQRLAILAAEKSHPPQNQVIPLSRGHLMSHPHWLQHQAMLYRQTCAAA